MIFLKAFLGCERPWIYIPGLSVSFVSRVVGKLPNLWVSIFYNQNVHNKVIRDDKVPWDDKQVAGKLQMFFCIWLLWFPVCEWT